MLWISTEKLENKIMKMSTNKGKRENGWIKSLIKKSII